LLKFFRGVEPTEEKLTALKNNLKLLDTFIGSNGYVASNKLTIADLSILASTSVFTVTNYDLSDYPNVKEWSDRLQKELPYFPEVNGKAAEDFKALIEAQRKDADNPK